MATADSTIANSQAAQATYNPYNLAAARAALAAYLARQQVVAASAASQAGVRPVTITNPVTSAVNEKLRDWATLAALTLPAWGTVLYCVLKKKRR